MLRGHTETIFILAGVFIFLPWLAQALYFPPPAMRQFDAAAVQAYLAYLRDNFPAVFATRLMGLLGTGAILTLLIGPDQPTVGDAIKRAGRFLPNLLLVDILVQLMWTLGFFALILPCLYLMGRTCLSQATMMAEGIGSPIQATARSFALTDQAGWRVFGFIAIVALVSWIGASAAMTVFGVVGKLLLPAAASTQIDAVLTAASTALLSIIAILVPAGLYRQLSGRNNGM